jgi:hypothetical protein
MKMPKAKQFSLEEKKKNSIKDIKKNIKDKKKNIKDKKKVIKDIKKIIKDKKKKILRILLSFLLKKKLK